jgi:DnaK suppressor protein
MFPLNLVSVAPLMSLRKEKIIKFQKEFLSRRDRLSQTLEQATADFINDDSSYSDSADQASADTGKSITVQMKNRDREELKIINEALRRIDIGTFGLCEECDEPISEARLKVNPASTLCIDCKSELELEEHRYPKKP